MGQNSPAHLRSTSRRRSGLRSLLVVSGMLGGLLTAVLAAEGPRLPSTDLQPEPEDGTFSFIVYGDIQGNHHRGHDRLVTGMLEEDASFVIHAGDISVNKGRGYDRDFLPVVRELVERIPFFPSPGNHDVDWGRANSRIPFRTFFESSFHLLADRFDNPQLSPPVAQKLWYSFRYADVLFIALDSNFFIEEGKYRRTHALEGYQGYRREQLLWLADQLREASRDPKPRAIFVYLHHSFIYSKENKSRFGMGGHPGHQRMMIDLALPAEAGEEPVYVLDLFRKHKVTAVFSGHVHYYERWRETFSGHDGTSHILNWLVLGNGGVKLRGKPKYKDRDIERVLSRRDFLGDSASRKGKNGSLHLEHAFPNEREPDGRFHSYTLVTVERDRIRFESKDTEGEIRDSDLLAVQDPPSR